MWEWLKLKGGSAKFASGGVVPKKVKPLKIEVYSSKWNWLLYSVRHEPCKETSGFKLSHKLIEPTGNWMIETKFGGEQTLFIEAKDRNNRVEYYNESILKIVPESQKFYVKGVR